MWHEASSSIQTYLTPNETLLWSGQPRKGLALRPTDALLIPFSLMWGGFAFFWEASVIISDAPFFFKLWGIPFVLVGFYLIVGRFFVDAQQRGKTYYGLTNERVVIVSGLINQQVKSLNLRTLGDISMSQKADGSGTITFGTTGPFNWGNAGFTWPGNRTQTVPCFEMIPQVKQVYDSIRAAQRGA